VQLGTGIETQCSVHTMEEMWQKTTLIGQNAEFVEMKLRRRV
jgi:hypothetical protein